ncbi:MAG: putative serine protease HtrA [Patescibacteria group bacterium]|nr:putative serine protease HtrA [Patescibacteria group bacterium]
MEDKLFRKYLLSFLLVALISGFVFGFLGGLASKSFLASRTEEENAKKTAEEVYFSDYEGQIEKVVKDSENSVVSIIATKDLPVLREYFIDPFGLGFMIPQYRQEGTKPQQVSAGSGFVIDSNGFIATNKHVVADSSAQYTVLMNDGKKYEATVIARDPVEDFAVLKINKTNLVPVKLGDSNKLVLGQTVIAIGNALGEFKNTVSVGVVSGLRRNISVTTDAGEIVTLDNVIQTDAAINPGNSGGPLLNLSGEVVGINTAMVSSAQNIGFALPINVLKNSLDQAVTTGKIKVPYLGVRYLLITPNLQQDKNLPVDYGALLTKGEEGEPAVEKNSPAAKAGLKENDIILEVNSIKVTEDNPLASLIRQYQVGETLILKVLRDNKTFTVQVVLEERPTNK